MIPKEKCIPKGTPLLFFNQPEIAPIKVRVHKSKKKGDEAVKCYIIGKNKKQIRLYTIEKLKTMNEDNYKLEASPLSDEEITFCTTDITKTVDNQSMTFELSYEQSVDFEEGRGMITVYSDKFEITKISLTHNSEDSRTTIDFSKLLLNDFANDYYLEFLSDEIKERFTGGCYDLI